MATFGRQSVASFSTLVVSAGLVGVTVIAVAWGAAADEKKNTGQSASGAKQSETIDALRTARLKLAENGYRAVLEGLNQTKRQGNVVVYVGQPERAYDWSQRWLEAEQDLAKDNAGKTAALEAHLQRLAVLEEKVKQLSFDLLPKAAVWDAEWHRLDAQLSLARAKEK